MNSPPRFRRLSTRQWATNQRPVFRTRRTVDSGQMLAEILLLTIGLSLFFMSLSLLTHWLRDSTTVYEQNFNVEREALIESDRGAPSGLRPLERLKIIDE